MSKGMHKMSEVHRIKCGNGNCYIVENGTNAILVDTGTKEYLGQVLKACRPYSVKLIILTHAHCDHAENAAQISEALGIPIGMNESDCDLIASNMNQELSAETLLGKIVLSASLKGLSAHSCSFQPNILLKDRDSLSDYGIDASIVSLPGHTNGSIGVDVDGKYLLVGDALMNMFYPTASMLYHNKNEMLESAEKISKIGNRIIYFGHGRPTTNKRWI